MMRHILRRSSLRRPGRVARPMGTGCGEAGLTLVDVMLAIVILAIGLVGLAAAIPMATTASQQGWQQSAAVVIAEEVLACMRVQPYANITTANFPSNGPHFCGQSPSIAYSYTVTVSNDTPITNTKTVTVAVTYQPMLSSPATVSISTIFATK